MPLSAWYMPESVEDQRAPNHLTPDEAVSEETLASYGVLYWKLSGDADDAELLSIKAERKYDYSDCITCRCVRWRWVGRGRRQHTLGWPQPGEAAELRDEDQVFL